MLPACPPQVRATQQLWLGGTEGLAVFAEQKSVPATTIEALSLPVREPVTHFWATGAPES